MTQKSQRPPVLRPRKNAKKEKALGESSPPSGYRPTQQLRSATSERKLLEAAERLFAEHGYAGTKVAEIIKESGCSTGSFYHRFSDKEGLARVLIQRYYETTKAAIEGLDMHRGSQGSLREMMTGIAEFTYDLMSQRLGVYRAALRVSQTAPEVWESPAALTRLASDRAIAVAGEYAEEITATDPAAAMQKSIQLIIMIILQTQLGSGNLFPTDRQELVDLVVNASLGILKLEQD